MSGARQPSSFLPPAECRDDGALRQFVQAEISPNAWPIHSRALRRAILRDGLDLGAAAAFSQSDLAVRLMMDEVWARSRRAERLLGIRNAFHTPLHNFEVLLRLLVLEWPDAAAMPNFVRLAPYCAHRTFDSIQPVLLDLIAALSEQGVGGHVLARDALAALGHDFGHSGGTDRTDRYGHPVALSQEDAAEKHIAKLGLEHGYPPALVLECMAGIRATTFFSRPGRDRIVPANEFERRLTLADVMGCVLPPADWLTHVSVPVLEEKIPGWRRRMAEIEAEQAELQARALALPEIHPERALIAARLEALANEDARIIRDLEEWFRSERGFFHFIEVHKLEPVAGAQALWGHTIGDKIRLIDDALSKRELLAPLAARGFAFLEQFAASIANAESLGERLDRPDIEPALRELLRPFADAGSGSAD